MPGHFSQIFYDDITSPTTPQCFVLDYQVRGERRVRPPSSATPFGLVIAVYKRPSSNSLVAGDSKSKWEVCLLIRHFVPTAVMLMLPSPYVHKKESESNTPLAVDRE